jgi:hypothetical protein
MANGCSSLTVGKLEDADGVDIGCKSCMVGESKYVLVPVTETAQFFLTSCVPNVEEDGAEVGVELERADFNTHCCQVTLLEFSRDVTFHERGLAHAAISDENYLESRDGISGRCCHGGRTWIGGQIGRLTSPLTTPAATSAGDKVFLILRTSG